VTSVTNEENTLSGKDLTVPEAYMGSTKEIESTKRLDEMSKDQSQQGLKKLKQSNSKNVIIDPRQQLEGKGSRLLRKKQKSYMEREEALAYKN